MNVVINGAERVVEPGTRVAELVAQLAPGRVVTGTAVAVNGEVVPRSEWERALLSGDRVEILTAVQGG